MNNHGENVPAETLLELFVGKVGMVFMVNCNDEGVEIVSSPIDVAYSKSEMSQGGDKKVNKIAVEFTRYVLQANPNAENFVAIYDAMSRAACARSFHNLGHQELALAGISFSLLDTSKLERIIAEARKPVAD